jgi:predicted amidohydrolase
LSRIASSLENVLEDYRRIAEVKNLKLWLGHPLLENGSLFNAYSLVTANGVIATQRKMVRWTSEHSIFEAAHNWQGNFSEHGYGILICWEVCAFQDMRRFERPTLIPELREAKPSLVVLPSYWVLNKKYLLNEARELVKPFRQKSGRFKTGKPYTACYGVRPEGCVVFVPNHNEAFVVCPHPRPTPSKKTLIAASLKKPGWIHVSAEGVETVLANHSRRQRVS